MTFTTRDLADLAAILREAGKREIMPRFRRLDAASVQEKDGPLDLVTVADLAAEKLIGQRVAARFPTALMVGEEGCAADPALLDRMRGADLAIVVDPIDGTSNYAAGLPLFGVMASVVVNGEVVAAAIHDPVGDDTALALRGEGAWIESPDGRRADLRVAPPVPVAAMTGSVSWRYLPADLRAIACRNLPRLAASWDYRCAAHQYRMLAGGHSHYLVFNRLLPWDHLAGWLLHREAGGYSAHFDGSPFAANDREGGLICAPDRASWDALRAALFTP